jgi:hypothetical protein
MQKVNLQLARGNESLEQSLGLLQKEVVDLREANKAQKQEIGGL